MIQNTLPTCRFDCILTFEAKRFKPKIDIVEEPENRVHRLTDSKVSRAKLQASELYIM